MKKRNKVSSITQRFLDLIERANTIVITTHLHPDADGIGSEVALCMALKKKGKNAICVNELALLERYKYLDPEDVVISYRNYQKKYKNQEIDLFIVTDTNALPRIGTQVQKLVTKSKELLFIDHHPCPKELAKIHCIDTSKAATGELVGTFIEAMNVKMTKSMALSLYTSILIDTSSFRYPTVTGDTHRVIANLMDTGVRPPEAYNAIYGTKKTSYLKLLGLVLQSAQTNKKETIGWISLTEENLKKYDVDPEDTHGFINHLLILDQVKVVLMFRQVREMVKISMRSVDDQTDVGIIAQALGGGGHNHSAATLIEGKVERVVPETIRKVEMMLEDD